MRELKTKVDALTQASMKLGEVIYKEAQQEAQKQQAKQGKNEPPKEEKKGSGKKGDSFGKKGGFLTIFSSFLDIF